jgi:hypothetical protein
MCFVRSLTSGLRVLAIIERSDLIANMFQFRSFERWICALVLVGVIALPLLSPRNPPNFTDWQVYVEAAHKLSEGKTVYDVVGHYQYKYAPLVAAAFALLLKVFSAPVLGWINWGLELALFGALFIHFGGLPSLRLRPFKDFAILVFGVGCLAISLRDEMKLGQLNLWCLWFLIGTWMFAKRARVKGAALFWMAAVSLKLYALILAPYFVFRREWRLLAWSLVFYIALSFAMLTPWFGLQAVVSENIEWLRSLTKSSGDLSASRFDVSMLGSFQKIGLPYFAAVALWGLALIAFLRESWVEAQSPHADGLRFFGRSMAWILILNPLVWPYWYLLLSPVFFASLDHRSRFSGAIPIPRLLWGTLCCALLIAIHRGSTPIGSSGVLVALMGIFLLLRPKLSPSA